jgi:excisionase family DNA binding protein
VIVIAIYSRLPDELTAVLTPNSDAAPPTLAKRSRPFMPSNRRGNAAAVPGIGGDEGKYDNMDTQRLPKLAYSIHEFAQAVGIGRTQVFQEIKTGRLRAAKVGRRTIITAEAMTAWLASLNAATNSDAALM